MEEHYRVILAEDHALVRQSLVGMLATALGLGPVGEAADGMEAIREVQKHRPDVVIMDLSLPLLQGTDAIREIKAFSPETRVVALTAHHTEEWLLAALWAGADAYVVKEAPFEELVTAVRSVLAGHRYLSARVCTPVLDAYLKVRAEAELSAERTVYDRLTLRERQILKLIGEGHPIKMIAELLYISPKTVEKGRTSLSKKLGLSTTAALKAYAVAKGLVEP